MSMSFNTNDDGEESLFATESIFHAPWLWYSDPTYIHPSSGQRLRRLGQFPGWKIAKVELVDAASASALEEEQTKVPNPAPPTGCLHSIGTVYSTKHHNSNAQPTSPTSDDHSNEPPAMLLKITWDTQNIIGQNQLRVESKETTSPSVSSFYDWNWLQRCRNDDEARRNRVKETQISPINAIGRHPSCPSILEVNYGDLFPASDGVEGDGDFKSANKDTLLKILRGISEQGAVLIREAPLGKFLDYDDTVPSCDEDDKSAAVAKVGSALGGGALSHGSLYGDLFHVLSMPKAVNIAYTTVALSPHQDLAYYESKPGLQLLHCIRNNQQRINGGESVLVDAVAAAEYLKEIAPQYFNTLCRLHATFVKQREGADMIYSRPHIVMGDMGQVVAVHWSPPFEGPQLEIPQDQVEEYIVAYAAFERLLDDQLFASSPLSSSALLPQQLDENLSQYAHNYTWERSLEPGNMLVFNNQRMLHGRRGFNLLESNSVEEDENEIHRHLAGCYTNIDDTINTYRMLLRDLPNGANRTVRCFGNGSGGAL